MPDFMHRRVLRVALAGALLACGGTALAGCARVLEGAIYAAPALIPISDEQEVAIGQQAAQQVIAQVPVSQDAALQQYVQQVGAAVASRSDRTNIPYRFTVLQAGSPDAFALPGGFIFITTGMLSLMENEAQLAGVLAHEVGHVAARHSVEMIRQAAIAQGIQAAAIGTQPGTTQLLANVARELVLRGYGREKELEADRLGALYAARQNYAPAQLAAFLTRLSSQGGGGGGTPGWLTPLSTHPSPQQRVTTINQFIASNNLKGTTTNAERFRTATARLR